MILITIPGEPVAQGRPKFSTRGGFVQTYDPKKSRDYKEYLKDYIQKSIKLEYPHYKRQETGAIEIEIMIYRSIPTSWSMKKKGKAILQEIMPTTRPDIDNYVKIVFDACNGLLWKDDSQICQLLTGKRYAGTPRIEIILQGIRNAV